MVSHYEFLASLHELLQPRGYLEIGVQTGASLALANCPAVGVDPQPWVGSGNGKTIFEMTSDEFFSRPRDLGLQVDLVYIDGMHLFEYALRDFIGCLFYANSNTVIVIDDVLPYNEAIADRVQPPGDWTGDVWKLIDILGPEGDADTFMVDVSPTGALVVHNLHDDIASMLHDCYNSIVEHWMNKPIPDWVLDRRHALTPDYALELLRNA